MQASNNTRILNTCTQLKLTGNPCGFNKWRSLKFRVGSSRVRQTPKEGWRIYRPKRCRNNNKDEDNSPKTFNDRKQWNCFPLSPKLQNWGLTIKCSLVSYIGNPFLWWGGITSLKGIQLTYSKPLRQICVISWPWEYLPWCYLTFSRFSETVLFPLKMAQLYFLGLICKFPLCGKLIFTQALETISICT